MRVDRGNLIFSRSSLFSNLFPPKHSLCDLCNPSQPVSPSIDPQHFIPLILNRSITPFCMPLSLYLSSPLPHLPIPIFISTREADVSECVRGDSYMATLCALCAVFLRDSRGSVLTLLCLNETERKYWSRAER